MRIAYLSLAAIPSRAANSVQVMRMCQAMARAGHDVTLFAPDREVEPGVGDPFRFYGVERCFELVKLPWATVPGLVHVTGIAFGWWAARAASRLSPDLVYGRHLPSCAFAARRGMPVVYESHGPVRDAGRSIERLYRGLVANPSLKRQVVISEALAAHYRDVYGLADDRLCVAHDAADAPPAAGPRLFPTDTLQVGYVGQLYPGKGVELVAALAVRCPWAHFHVVGGNPEAVADWEQSTREVANLTFHGFVEPGRLEAHRASCDVLLAPYGMRVAVAGERGDVSRWMSPLKLFEYMASARAIVCADLPVLREVLEDGVNAILCPPAQVDAWVTALERLRDAPEEREALGRRARADFEAQHTWQARVQRVLAGLPLG